MIDSLNLPARPKKPRSAGVTCLIDIGYPSSYFEDVIRSHQSFIDFVKFGWGTSLVTEDLDRKTSILREHSIAYLFGGTLLELAVLAGKVMEFTEFVRRHRCDVVEVSDGTIAMKLEEKCSLISSLAREFTVWSEVGYKDIQRSLDLPPSKWVQFMNASLESGASMVVTEARESGTGGICRADGQLRFGLIEDIIGSKVNLAQVMFEAPKTVLQTYFIKRIGPNVNLANIAFGDVLGLETLRLGLRSDTLSHYSGGTNS